MHLNPEQKKAVECLSGPLLVLAGPGTGKTQIISQKVAYILNHTDAAPDNILCLTFSESACDNMRERLSTIIGAEAAKVNIFTYHAFGQNLLGQYRNYSPVFERNLDAAIDEATKFHLLKSLQASLPAFDILRGDKVSDIASTISSAKSHRLTPEDLAEIAQINLEKSQQIQQDVAPYFDELVPRMKYDLAKEQVYGPIAHVLANYISTEPILPARHGLELPVYPEANQMLEALQAAFLEAESTPKPKLTPLSNWKNRYFELDGQNHFRLKNLVANKKLQSLSVIMQKYETYLRENELCDFDDMIQEAVRALRTDEGFCFSMAERYQYILLDEFQDTNQSQLDLVRLIAQCTDSPDIMAVGDDDQAIYEFQGANAGNFSLFRKIFSARLIVLTENYRCSADILDFSRHIADQIDDSFAKTDDVPKNLHPNRPPEQSDRIERHQFLSADAECFWVANQISDLIAAGVPQRDIAVITARHKSFLPLLPFLKQHPEIKIAYEKRDNLLAEPRLVELFTFARYIADFAYGRPNQHHLMEVASLKFLRLDPLAVHRAINNREKRRSPLDALADSSDESLQEFARAVLTLAGHAESTPLDLFLDYLIGAAPLEAANWTWTSPFLSFYTTSTPENLTDNAAAAATFSLYEQLSVLRQKIREHFPGAPLTLAHLIKFLDAYEEASLSIPNTSPYRESANAVQLLSVHKAKGLEFKYVFLTSVDNNTWGLGSGNNNQLTLPNNLTFIRHTDITDGERLRSLFVAITRAKSRLILTSSTSDISGKSRKPLAYLAEAPNPDQPDQLLSPYLPKSTQTIISHVAENLERPLETTDLKTAWMASYFNPTPDLRAELLQKAAKIRYSASALTEFIDLCYGGPQAFFQKHLLGAYLPGGPSAAFGNFIHATFEQIVNQKLTLPEALEVFAAEVDDNYDLLPDERAELLRQGKNTIEAAYPAFSPLLLSPNAHAEQDFSFEHLSLGDVPITGKIDLLIVDPKAKTIEIYDYKTGKFRDKKWDSHPTLLKYRLQLCFYKLLLQSSPKYAGYRITAGHILFVTPDRDGAVHDRLYEFTPEADEELHQLLHAVATHVRSLDFLDNPDLCPAPDPNASATQIRAFIQALIDQA